MADLNKLCFGCMREKPDFSPECTYCKYDGTTDNAVYALPIKTELQKRYIIGKSISENGEGLTYIAYDRLSDCVVRLREYFPQGICERINLLVKPFSKDGFTFDKVKSEFLALAKGLSRMNGFAGLLDITDIFEENGTVYYVTENVEAISLRDFLLRNGGSLSYEQYRSLFMPLFSTLSSLHAVDIIHRGISPDTIIIGKDGKLRLTDFCVSSVRTARCELKSQLLKGYAAIEQYGFDGEQGAWTDVYALGATMYRIIVGNPPPEATARVTNDKMTIPASVAVGIPQSALSALANALEIMPDDRTKTVEEFKNMLTVTTKTASKVQTTGKPNGGRNYRNKVIIISALVTAVVVILTMGGIWAFMDSQQDAVVVQTTTTTTTAKNSEIAIDPDSNEVPQFMGAKYSDILSSPEYIKVRARFVFEVSSKQYGTQPYGTIISQSPNAGTTIQKGQVVKFVISLGNEKFAMPNIVGLSKNDAYIKLLEAGFRPENIIFGEKYLPNSLPEAVVDVSPNVGESVSADMRVTVNINTYATTTTVTTTTTTPPTTVTKAPTTLAPMTTKRTKPTTTLPAE